MGQRGVFLDRDGTINEEVEYLSNVDQLKLIDGATEAIRLLNNAGYKVVVITNQSGIARGYITEAQVKAIHTELEKMLQKENAHIDGIYYCPHHPEAEVDAYRVDCDCRKPKPGMLMQAANDLGIDLKNSFIVGDKISDLGAGDAAGCRKILVRTGYGKEMEKELRNVSFQADHITDNVLDAVKWIISQAKNQERDSDATSIA